MPPTSTRASTAAPATSEPAGGSPDRPPARRVLACLTALLLAACPFANVNADALPECVYVSSYHAGYTWSDRIEQGLRDTLSSRCHITSVFMDTKRKRDAVEQQAAAAAAFQIIQDVAPAVVITSDDAAAKHLIVPYLKDSRVSVVFTGINWTVEEYGFPWPNVTGIVEVAPLRAMLQQGMRIAGRPRRAAYLAANAPSEWKNVARLKRESRALGIRVHELLADNMVQFESSFITAQDFDILILGGNVGIRDWDAELAREIALRHTDTFSVTTRDWMMPFTMLGLTKMPEEHGTWAGESAIAILDGRSPSSIPLATNRRWESWVNGELLELGGFAVPASTLRKARQVVLP